MEESNMSIKSEEGVNFIPTLTNKMIAIDWSHTKQLVTYDGKSVWKGNRAALLKRLRDGGMEESNREVQSEGLLNSIPPGVGESIVGVQSIHTVNLTPQLGEEAERPIQSVITFNSPNLTILETGCPISLIYALSRTGYIVRLVKGQDVKAFRTTIGSDKSDEIDALSIYNVADLYPHLLSDPITLDNQQIQLMDSWHRFYRTQKARVGLSNQMKGFQRYFGSDGEGMKEALEILKKTEATYLREAKRNCPPIPERLQKIKGLGEGIWASILATANPINFKTLSRYLRFLGFVDKEQIGSKFNRLAKRNYYLLADQIIRHRDPQFRPFYDKVKGQFKERYPDWKAGKVNGMAVNRLCTFLAKEIYLGYKDALSS